MNQKCREIQELLASYIDRDLQPEIREEIDQHLPRCPECRALKQTMESLLERLPDLEEEIPFFLRNRLLNIPDRKKAPNRAWTMVFMGKWAAALIGSVLLFLNLFYFTDIYPAANRTMHSVVSQMEKLVSQTGGFVEKVRESKNLLLFTFFSKGTLTVKEVPDDGKRVQETIAEQGGKNG